MVYTAEFEPGDEERLAGWEVVKWTTINENGRIGYCVEAFYGENAESDAILVAEAMNREAEQELYAEFG
jgi:hypothetical protein